MSHTEVPPSADAAFAEEWRSWHAGHEAVRADEHGFLSITGMYWLTGEPQRITGIPGEWWSGPAGPVVRLAAGEQLTVDGVVLSGVHEFGVVPEGEGVEALTGDIVVEVARRGGSDVVRPRDPAAPVRAAYAGTPAYAPDPRWRLTGRFVPFDRPRPTTVGSVVEGLELVHEARGRIEFTVDGQPLALTAFDDGSPDRLLVLFTDATSGVTTYAANRQLKVTGPAADGTVTVDFNRATNLPCAYTAFATCPLPPPENRLPVAVEAGEQKPAA
ncbi:DUF1684 domain-containing protein [Modestobacter sp. VKM Ac-2986]|uniref:DUF1684 domain-containing protein n=1 Tax=Modestobacter sp. VKM Ac-2986 TaxID=3004140 RepID=UPI0022AADAE5|nr:DUF1684 domain-containing protein [Modestobacter sp. VKM Ac-2986]MCZ2829191.1 DUF1684 domain-containing protein [Modestobacter sp. VKM Ac-2986]